MRNSRLMRGLAVVVASVAVLALAGSSQAGLIAGGVDAMPGYFGERTFNYSAVDYTLAATVDFAVYAPHQYPGTDPSAGRDYVYAYQVFESPSSTVGTGYFSVGLASGSGAHHSGDDTSATAPGNAGGETYDLARVGSSSVYWLFDPDIAATDHSTTLLFTSPFGPTWMSGALADGGLPTPGDGLIVSPMPEPATLSLLALGGLALLRRRKSV